MAHTIMLIGIGLAILGAFGIYAVAFSRGFQFALLSLIFPFVLLVLIADEAGQKAWGCLAFGAILAFIGMANGG